MKNLLNCHVKGLHSFPVSFENGLYKRLFFAGKNHELWKEDPLAIAIHPHHVDIKITVISGLLVNRRYELSEYGQEYNSFKWNSHILNGNGGFIREGSERIGLIWEDYLVPFQTFEMKSCELHTVFVDKGETCAWIIEEQRPTCGYNPINYSNWDLEKWDRSGLYIEVSDEVKEAMVGHYIKSDYLK